MKLSASVCVALFVLSGPVATAAPASTRPASIDQDTLIPPPPEGYADCWAAGNRIICHTGHAPIEPVNEPMLDLPCGTVYETSQEERRGIRWYDATSRTIVKRSVAFDLRGSWSLSANGTEPTVRITVHARSRDVSFPDLYDSDTWPTTFHGVGFTVWAPGFGVIVHVNHEEGYDPDDEAHGVTAALAAPRASSELCAALGS